MSDFIKNNDIPIVGILRGIKADDVLQVLAAFQEAGLKNIELTMNTFDAFKLIELSVKEFSSALCIGAGTVTTVKETRDAINAGATFIVTPIAKKEIALECKRSEVPFYPGAMTPTEIFDCWQWGAKMVKVFPARELGASYFKAIKAPFPRIALMATGGIDLDNMQEFLLAGASGFGIGSTMFSPEIIAQKDWKQLTQRILRFKNALISFDR